MNDLHTLLAGWSNFYLVTASAAAALTGLQFVVQTLMTSELIRGFVNTDPEAGINTFATPTVVHFSLTLLISAVLCAPWTSYSGMRETLFAITIAGFIYQVIVFRRARRQQVYTNTLYDWVWYVTFPFVAYTVLLVSVIVGPYAAQWPPFMAAAGVLLLLGVGIHNAWDTVTYMTIMAINAERKKAEGTE
jgi:hypothetical protein